MGVLAVPQLALAVVGGDPAGREGGVVLAVPGGVTVLPAVVALDVDRSFLPVHRHAVLGEPRHGTGVGGELRLVEDALFQVRLRVAVVDGHDLLGDDRAGVDVLRGDVDGTASHLRARGEHLLVGVHPGEGGQERGVDVDRRRRGVEERVGEDPHVPVHADEVELVLREGVEDPVLVGFA